MGNFSRINEESFTQSCCRDILQSKPSKLDNLGKFFTFPAWIQAERKLKRFFKLAVQQKTQPWDKHMYHIS